jgi:hypothetical protein
MSADVAEDEVSHLQKPVHPQNSMPGQSSVLVGNRDDADEKVFSIDVNLSIILLTSAFY